MKKKSRTKKYKTIRVTEDEYKLLKKARSEYMKSQVFGTNLDLSDKITLGAIIAMGAGVLIKLSKNKK